MSAAAVQAVMAKRLPLSLHNRHHPIAGVPEYTAPQLAQSCCCCCCQCCCAKIILAPAQLHKERPAAHSDVCGAVQRSSASLHPWRHPTTGMALLQTAGGKKRGWSMLEWSMHFTQPKRRDSYTRLPSSSHAPAGNLVPLPVGLLASHTAVAAVAN
jgi:hypothetical protein